MIERPAQLAFNPAHLMRGFGGTYFTHAVIAFVFAASAPVAIILTTGQAGGLSQADIASWIFGCFFINGLISLLFCLVYRQPLVFFWTIPGTVLVSEALTHLSFAEVIGAFYGTGLLMLALGLTGWARKIMARLPMPIVMAMVAGVFLQFGLDLVSALENGFSIAGPMVAAFIVLSVWSRAGRLIPPLIGALLVGIATVAAVGGFHPTGSGDILARPIIQSAAFSWPAMIELVVPLAITVLAAQNAQGYAVLEAAGHRPPVNAVTLACGAGSILTAAVGSVSTCLTGPTNAILASSGERQYHYGAAVLVALLALIFGLFSPLFTRYMLATPGAFIATLAGLALLPVLQRAFIASFKGAFTMGATVTFLVTVSGLVIFSIGAPFWGLVIGYGASRALERADFRTLDEA